MARVYFNCASDRKTLTDTVGLDLGDLREARKHAAWVMQSLITLPILEDWRSWTLRVRDARGEEILTVPFAPAVGKPN